MLAPRIVQYVKLAEIEGGQALAHVALQQFRPVALVLGLPAASSERLGFSGVLSATIDGAGILSLPISWANARVVADPLIAQDVIGLLLAFPSAEHQSTLRAILSSGAYALTVSFWSWPPRGSSLWVSGFSDTHSRKCADSRSSKQHYAGELPRKVQTPSRYA